MNSLLGAPAFLIAFLLLTGFSAATVVTQMLDEDDHDDGLETIHGTVTAFLYDDDDMDHDDDEMEDDDDTEHDEDDEMEDDDDMEHDEDDEMEDDEDDDEERNGDWDKPRLRAFVIDNNTTVEFGPWWYWMYMGINITDIVHIGDEVNVTGELKEDGDDKWVMEAWHIDNLTTGEELTIKGEGRPPWAGGPKALGISPWPPSDKEE